MSSPNYTSQNLDNVPTGYRPNKVLFAIKTKGPIATAILAKSLGMTAEAARQQVQKLLAEGLIVGIQSSGQGPGRPRQSWVVSTAGNRCFPDTHAQLSGQLINSIRTLFGEDGLEKLIIQREEEARILYQRHCDSPKLAQRLQQLAQIRSDEGYMARVEASGGDWLLIEDHCPICVAAQACQNFCRSELQLFQEIIGEEAKVIREQHLLNQGARCVYRITPVASHSDTER